MLYGIYAISDTKLSPYSILKDLLKLAIEGGISLFQLRDKNTPDSALKPLCLPLMELCQTHNIPFILNDRIELAISLKTQGLHVGKKQDDTPYSLEELKQIRSSFNGILGVSCYGDLNLARNAKLAKVDYVAFGSCFNSPTKPNAKTIPLDIFTQAKHLEIPMCAIGGIQKENITQIQNAQMAACISSIWQGDVKKNVQELSKKFKQGQEWI